MGSKLSKIFKKGKSTVSQSKVSLSLKLVEKATGSLDFILRLKRRAIE